jgi:hypothetical protein
VARDIEGASHAGFDQVRIGIERAKAHDARREPRPAVAGARDVDAGGSHGLFATHTHQFNADLLEFAKA